MLAFLGHHGYDDPYVTFRYARNLLSGRGLVYNVGQRTLSTSAPFYAVLVGGLGLLCSNLPVVSNIVSAISLLGSAAFLVVWSSNRGQQSVGLLAGLLLTLSPGLLATFGAETCFYTMLILFGLFAYDRSWPVLSAFSLAAATMVRPDGLVAAVWVAIFHLLRRRPLDRWAVILYVGLVSAFYAGLWLYFGSPIPSTLLAKQQQGSMLISRRFLAGFVDLVREPIRDPLFIWVAALTVIGLGRVLVRSHYWLLLLGWTAAYFLAYSLLGVSGYFWYYAPLAPAAFVLVAEGVAAATDGIRRLTLSRSQRAVLVAALMVSVVAFVLPRALIVVARPDPRLAVYSEAGQWLKENTPPDAQVGALEVGIIGYHSGRPMVDFAGLIQPDVARRLEPGASYADAATYAIRSYRPDYVVLSRALFTDVGGSDWFQASYTHVRDFVDQEASWLSLYRRDAIK